MISSEVKRILVAPLVITVVLSAGLVWNPRAAYSALLGGTIGLIANSYAAWRIFSRGKGVSADYELYNFYRAEIGKLV
ncbi:MAG: ATP synthase subunit I, partial [Gammaproteobacteria bacterium]|nr:ATP synthase subunit I [Gammaproteobacteria bacterium]